MNRLILAALGLWILLAAPMTVSAREGDHDAAVTVEVNCGDHLVLNFRDDDNGFVTFTVLEGDRVEVVETTLKLDEGEATIELALPPNGDYTVVFDDEQIIDKSFWEEPFTVDCKKPTPTPSQPTPPPCNCTTPPTLPPHKTVPPSDTASLVPADEARPLIAVILGLIFMSGVFFGAAAIFDKRRR